MAVNIDIDDFICTVGEFVKDKQVPVVDLTAVQTRDPFKVLVATILSARTKDETTAVSAAKLFARADTADKLAKLSEKEIEKLIHPVGFFRNKAKYLKALPEALAVFNHQVPDEIDDLVKLPGVGRKTANLVRSVAFGKPAICVDTHVHRIMNIWGYVKTDTPLQTEMALRKKLPEKYWLTVNSTLVAFGQAHCRPIGPHCNDCPLKIKCPQIGVTPRKTTSRSSHKGNSMARRFVSWNLNGIRAVEKKGLLDIIKDFDADVIAFQETKAQPDQLSEKLLNPEGYTAYWHSAEKKGYSGVGFYTRTEPINVLTGIGNPLYDSEGRVLTLEFANCFLINIYFPNSGEGLKRLDYKLSFNESLADFADELGRNKPVILCGDFNVAHKPIDLKNPKRNEKNAGYTPEERAWMDSFIERGYTDTFRMFNNEPEQYSWWSYRFNARAKNIGWRIDYFCVDEAAKKNVVNAEIMQDVMGSDHCPVLLEYKS